MQFVTLKPAEFTRFANSHPNKSFFQTTEIAKLREKNGWTAYYFGVKTSDKIIAAAMAVARPTFLGKSTYYIPGGPLLDYEDTALVEFFFENLKNYAKSHNGYLLHIEPYYELIERNREGDVVPGGFHHQKAVQNLKALGFTPVTPDNPKYLFTLELKGRKKDELFASFKQNTRNLISRTAKSGVVVRELTREELPLFKHITEETSERRHFDDKSLGYYETMYDLFAKKGEVKFLIAEVDVGSEDIISRQSAGASSQNGNGHGRVAGTEIPGRDRLTRCDFDDCEPRTPRNNTSEPTPIAAAMFMTYGDEVIYLFSGSDEKYMKQYNAQYAIQWYMIQYALKHGFKRYNFYGIQGLPDPKKTGYGIYRFKKGFTTPENGRVVELLGAFEMSTSIPFYLMRQALQKLKRVLKK